jgi:hypothetical protein
LVDHGHRLEAAEIGVMLHDLKPAEKHDVSVGGDLTVNIIDRFGKAAC